jgi:hypothetical protein
MGIRAGLDTSEINILPMPGSELRFLGFPAHGYFTAPPKLFWFFQIFLSLRQICGNILSYFTAVLLMAQFAVKTLVSDCNVKVRPIPPACNYKIRQIK